jgi:hypothetical protein
MLQPFHARPTTTLPSVLVPRAVLNNASHGAALGAIEPSSRHSAVRCQIPACSMLRASVASPTMVRPSRLTALALRPPMYTTPVVGIQ